MKTFEIETREILSRIIEIKANSKEEAIEKIEQMYKKEEIVLDYSDFLQVTFTEINSDLEK